MQDSSVATSNIISPTSKVISGNSNGAGGLIIPTSPPVSGGAPGVASAAQFESCKREATRLERQLEDKIAKYQELSQRYTTFCHNHNSTNSNAFNRMETGSGSNNNNHDKEEFQKLNHEEETLKHDIQRSLRNLQEYIENRLVPLADTNHQRHLVKRYREIWLDSSQDFEKSRCIIQRYKDRIELFAHSQATSSEGDDPEAAGMDALLRERNHINNSINATSSILDQASAIRQDLRQQGLSLTNIRGTIGGIVQTIPGLNSLVDRIKRKRSRDDYILSGVIASCVLFTLWYMFG